MKIALTRNRISIAMSTVAFIGLTLILIFNLGAKNETLSLAPIPYEMSASKSILQRTTTFERSEYPGVTTVEIYYKPASGKSVWVGAIHYTTVAQYKEHALADEVPLYGAQVKIEKEMSLSAIGAQEPYYDLSPIDRERTSQINVLIYKAESFTRVQ